MIKEEIIKSIIDISQQQGLQFETNYKCDKWSADIIVAYSTYKVAFNICKSPRKVEEIYKAMRKERVCGCWLLLPQKSSPSLPKYLPCFKLIEETDRLHAAIHSNFYDTNKYDTLDFDSFIISLIKGNIKFAQNIKVKFIEICLFDFKCWKCNKISQVYFINRFISADGVSISPDDIQLEDIESFPIIENLEFNPIIVNAIEQYIRIHPEKNIIMGKIKPRYSGTRQQSYPSFGCAFCDSIFGKSYIQEIIYELIYCSDTLPKALIEINENIIMPANRWYRKTVNQ